MAEARLLAFEFIIWFVWLGLFALAQRRFCRKYPGMRSVCRNIFLFTSVVAVLPGIWLLYLRPDPAHLMILLNHCFGIGVFAQTFLRAALMLKWIAWLGIHRGIAAPLGLARNEPILLASLAVFSQSLGGRKSQPAARRSQ
jgi:hypothetical protein